MASLDLNLTVSNNQKALDILDAFCTRNSYDPASGKTKAQFLKDKVKAYILGPYRDSKLDTLITSAYTTVQADLDSFTVT